MYFASKSMHCYATAYTVVSVLVLGIGIARGQYYWILGIGCLVWYRSNPSLLIYSRCLHILCRWDQHNGLQQWHKWPWTWSARLDRNLRQRKCRLTGRFASTSQRPIDRSRSPTSGCWLFCQFKLFEFVMLWSNRTCLLITGFNCYTVACLS